MLASVFRVGDDFRIANLHFPTGQQVGGEVKLAVALIVRGLKL